MGSSPAASTMRPSASSACSSTDPVTEEGSTPSATCPLSGRTRRVLRRLALGLLMTTVACGGGGGGSAKKASTTTSTQPLPTGARIALASSAFKDGGAIPAQFTCDGAGQSPPLSWTGVPPGTASLALRVQDIDT